MNMPLTKNNLYSDNEVFCGGVGQQFKKNKGKCGVCGDDWSAKRPRLNENGGTWGTGTIGKTYFQGQVRITKLSTNFFNQACLPWACQRGHGTSRFWQIS